MSDLAKFQVELFSPRWGRVDIYEFQLSRDRMRVEKTGSLSFAVCSWIEGRDPLWSGSDKMKGDPLGAILENDSIYPPSIFVRALTFAWLAWRDSELNNEQAEAEVKVLSEWLNVISQSRPKTDFWRRKF